MREFIRYRIVLPFYTRIYWPIAVRVPFVAAVYFCFFDRSFWQEFQSTLAGKAKYYQRNSQGKANCFLLRRNTHRLEKGLIMRPRRDVFATGYIGQTVDGLAAMRREDDPQLWKWAFDVLTEYFRVTVLSTHTDMARRGFAKISGVIGVQTADRFVPSVVEKRSTIVWDDLLRLAIDRRSVRWFTEQKVRHSDIAKAMKIALLSPSACNRQPFKYLVFDDPSLIQAVATIPRGTAGFSHNIRMIVAVIGELDAYSLEQDRHVIYIDGSLSAMSFMYALETLGLSSCPINWPDSRRNDQLMQQRFGLQSYERTIMLIAIGYHDRDGLVPRSTKKTFDQVVEFNRPFSDSETCETRAA